MIGFALFARRTLIHRCWRWPGLLRSAASAAGVSATSSEEDRHAGFATLNFHDAGAMRVVKQMGPAILASL